MDLHPLRRNWLAHAEVSPSGISFFFPDRPEYEAFADLVKLPESARRDADEVVERYDLVPRRWVKVHARGGGFSQYHVISSAHNPYPITTLRQVMRRYQQGEPRLLEAGLKPALERADSIFAFVIKNEILRISVRIPRQLLGDSLQALNQAGLICASLARAHLAHDPAMGPSPNVYLTFQPTDPAVLSVDYERPTGHTKCRFQNGQAVFSDYRSLPETLPEDQLAALCQTDHDLEQIRAHFDALELPSCQLGQLKQGPRQTHLDLALRAGVESGMRILDVGCGQGGWAWDLLREIPGVELHGITLSGREAARARERGVNAVAGDYHELPFPAHSFDRVAFLESFSYARDPARALAEAYRVLRPGGRIFIKDFFRHRGPLQPAERLELAEFQRVHHSHPPVLENLPGLSGFQVQALQPPYRLQPYEDRTFRRFFHLPLSLQALLSPPRSE
jgi:SAM-dependent methyltransferase